MLSPIPSRGFIDLDRSGLLEIIFPELVKLQGIETRNGRAHKDNFYHTLQVLDNLAKVTQEEAQGESKDRILWLRWAALLHDIGKPVTKRWDPVGGWTFYNHNFQGEKMVPEIFRRMKLPMNEKMKYVQKLVGLHMRPQVIADDVVTDSAVRRLAFEAGDDIGDLMLLCEADITSKNEEKKQRFLQNFQLVRQKIETIKHNDEVRLMQPIIDGNEVMRIFGLPQGPKVGQLKQAMKNAILNGDIYPNTRETEMEFLLKKAASLGLSPVVSLEEGQG